jgi:hypothetical protein
MLEARVKELRNQSHRDSTHNESLNARLVHFLRKEADEEDNDNEEDQQALPSGSSDDNGTISRIRFPRVMRWLKCPICLNNLYDHKNCLLFHIESFINDEMSPPPTWSNNISIFLGCSIWSHEWSVRIMNLLYGGWTTDFWCMVDKQWMVIMNIVWWMNLQVYYVFSYLLLMCSGWTMYDG